MTEARHPTKDWRQHVLRHGLLAPILFLAAAFRLVGLADNGYGRSYYAAAVRGMLQSWHNVWFNAFDPAGFVSLDKPPVAICVQALSAKLRGFSGWSVLLPQAIEGILAVGLVYAVVQRTFGRAAGLIAALLLPHAARRPPVAMPSQVVGTGAQA